MFIISYADKPDEPVFTFSTVGDTVKIGRDKRICKICLGAAAQGVSRVHMCIQLKKIGNRIVLMSKDMSTYGIGYNGGPIAVWKEERELTDRDILQIGFSEFVIDEKHPEITLSDSDDDDDAGFVVTGYTIPPQRYAIKRPTDIEGSTMAKQSKNDGNGSTLDRFVTNRACNNEVQNAGYSASALLDEVDAASQMMTQPRIIVNDSRAVTQASNNAHSVPTLDECESSEELLPPDDGDSDSEMDSEEDVSSRGPFVLAEDSGDENSPRKRRVPDNEVGTTVPESEFDAWENDEQRNAVLNTDQRSISQSTRKQQNRHCNLFDSASLCGTKETINKILNDSIVAGPSANQGHIADLDPHLLNAPAFHSTQRDSVALNSSTQHHFLEPSNTQPSRTTSAARSQQAETTTKRRGHTQNENEPSAGANGGRGGGRLMSWINQSKVNDKSSVFDSSQFRNEVEGIPSKKLRVNEELIQDQDVIMEESKAESMNKEENDELEQNDDDNGLIIGLDRETLRKKLANIVQYSDLEKRKPDSIQPLSQISSTSGGSDSSSLPNFKRFRKAQQGCYSQQSQPGQQQITQIIGTTDMVDFRSLSSM